MKVTAKRAAMTAVAVLGFTNMARAVPPSVSGVQMAQITGARMVAITYNLVGEDAIVTLSIETNGVAIPDSAVTRLTGDVCKKVTQGAGKSITWNAGADWPENITDKARARVTAWCTNAPPQYCVVDLSAGSETNSYPVSYYVSAEALPDGGLINDLYRTVRLAMRRIRTDAADPKNGNGVFMMGALDGEVGRNSALEDYHQVTLTDDFYAGVFQVTQGQWQQVMGDVPPWPANFTNKDYKLLRPVEQVSYYDIRENPAGNSSAISPNWPQSGGVGENSFISLLRERTGLAGFDLPTEAQWEYACRAGTARALNVPLPAGANLTNSNADANMDPAGRYKYNGGFIDGVTEPEKDCTAENGTAMVGAYAPNAWGLYDMHGNVWEWCLDWYGNGVGKETDGHLGTGAVTDPQGAPSGLSRVQRGGSWNYSASSCRAASRYYRAPNLRYNNFGFRLVRTLP